MLREWGWQGQNPSGKFVLVRRTEVLVAFLVKSVTCALSSLTFGQKLGSRIWGAVPLRRQKCCHGWWEEAVAGRALLYVVPHHLYYILLPLLTCMSYTCRWVLKGCLILCGCTFCSFYFRFLLQDYKVRFWKKKKKSSFAAKPSSKNPCCWCLFASLSAVCACVFGQLGSFRCAGTSKPRKWNWLLFPPQLGWEFGKRNG